MSRSFLINLVLAVIWMAVTGAVNSTNLLVGFAVGYLILLVAQPLIPVSDYVERGYAAMVLLLVFGWELLLSSLRVALDIVTPDDNLETGVIALPLDVESDLEITVLASLISLTPGTLTLDHSTDRRFLYIHVMHIRNRDVEAERQRIKRILERPVRQVFGKR